MEVLGFIVHYPRKSQQCLSPVPRVSSPSLSMTLVRFLHALNESHEIFLKDSGKVTFSIAVFLNAKGPIFSRPSENSTSFRFSHYENVPFSITFSVDGIFIFSIVLSENTSPSYVLPSITSFSPRFSRPSFN